MENNVIYISDSESSNVGDSANVVARSTDVAKKRTRNKILMGDSLIKDIPHESSPPPPPPRQMDASAPRILRGGGYHRFIPYSRLERTLPLPDYIDDPSGMTLDLLSQMNQNLSGSAPNPRSLDHAIDLDLKL